MQLVAEPYKCDNAKLVKECNDLHLTFLQYRENNEKVQKGNKMQILLSVMYRLREFFLRISDLKRKISSLEVEKSDRDSQIEKLRSRVAQLDLDLVGKSQQLLACTCKAKREYPLILNIVRTKLREKYVLGNFF